MCWNTNLKQYSKRHVATEDISVFKVVKYLGETSDGKMEFCPYYYFDKGIRYTNDKTYEEPSTKIHLYKEFFGKKYFVERGFHSYNSQKVCIVSEVQPWTGYVKIRVSPNGSDDAFLDFYYPGRGSKHLYCLNCVIPKGATYYENEYGEMVSNAIHVVGGKFIDTDPIGYSIHSFN